MKRLNHYHLLLECVVLRFKDFFCPGKNTILCTKLCQLKIKRQIEVKKYVQRRSSQLKTQPASRAFLLLPSIWRAYLYQEKDKRRLRSQHRRPKLTLRGKVTRDLWAGRAVNQNIAATSFLFISLKEISRYLAFEDLSILFLIQSLLFSTVACNATPERPAQRSRVFFSS